MEQEIWMYEPLLKDISDSQSLTGNALRGVCLSLNADSCAVWLNEYEAASDKVLLFRPDGCRYVSPDDPAFAELRRCAPVEMSCRTACRFGSFYCEKDVSALSARGQRAFSLFCEFLYSKFMTGFSVRTAPVTLDVKNIVVNYGSSENSPNVLNGVSFKIHSGQLTVLMGPSGCGKSTLLNVMGGLLKPTCGSVCYGERDVCGYNKRQMNHYRRNNVGFVFQNYNLIADLTVGENVQVAQSLASRPAGVQEILDSVGVGQYKDEYPFHLSGGEQQRVCIARALVKNADILLCDEPTGALDTVNSKNIMTILQQKAKEFHNAVVVVTHNPDYEVLADHYINMRNGSILLDEYRPFPYKAEEYL